MWHETKDEMMEMLKSLFRMDEDQSARRVAQKYLKVVDADYYEFESECNNKIHRTNIVIIHKLVQKFCHVTLQKRRKMVIIQWSIISE